MAKLTAAEKARAGLRHAVVCPNVTGMTKERIAQSKRAQQYVREVRNLFSDKESVGFRDFGGNDPRLRPFTVEV